MKSGKNLLRSVTIVVIGFIIFAVCANPNHRHVDTSLYHYDWSHQREYWENLKRESNER